MKNKTKYLPFILIMALFLVGCNLPTASAKGGLQQTVASPTPTIDQLQMPTLVPLGTSTAYGGAGSEPTLSDAPLNLPDTITFLLLGSDSRDGNSFRTDTILLAFLRPNEGSVSIVSIPRDLWVNIPEVGEQRINVAYQYGDLYEYPGGGAGLLKETILENLGVQIDHVAMVDFDGFRKIVDTIGGIQIPIACSFTDWRMIDPSMDPELEESWAEFTLQPGVTKMDGEMALWYARSRKMSSDFDRGRRQQEVIRAVYQQALNNGSISKIPQLYSDLSSSFTTDLGLVDILALSPMALHLGNANIRGFYISGDLVTETTTDAGAEILLPNTEAIKAMLAKAMGPSDRPQEKQKILVEVLNGSTVSGQDVLAAERLNYAGYQTVVLPFDRSDYTSSLVYDLTQNGDKPNALAIANVMGLQPEAVVSNPGSGTGPSFAFIIGNDYDACFDPAEINPQP